MLSIAGVIGAGLFVGSGRAIAEAGPATILAYIPVSYTHLTLPTSDLV